MKTRTFLIALAAAISIAVAGCLENEATTIVRYQPGTDLFAILTVYQHFRSSGPDGQGKQFAADAEKVERLWSLRNHIVPVEPSIFGDPVYIELSDDRKTLATPDVDSTDVTIAWEQIKIGPGKMFRDADGALSYYHETQIPGLVVDQWLRLAKLRLAKNGDLLKLLADERARRAENATRGSWTALREKVQRAQADSLDRLERKLVAQSDNQGMASDFMACLDNESFLALERAIEKADLEITRKGQTVTLRLPLSKSDADETATILANLGKAWAEFAAGKQADDGPEAAMCRLLFARIRGALAFKASAKGLDLSVELADAENAITSALSEMRDSVYRKDPKSIAVAIKMAETVGPKVAVSEEVTVENVVADFLQRAGK